MFSIRFPIDQSNQFFGCWWLVLVLAAQLWSPVQWRLLAPATGPERWQLGACPWTRPRETQSRKTFHGHNILHEQYPAQRSTGPGTLLSTNTSHFSKDNLYQCQCQIAHPPPGTNSSNLVSTLKLNCHFKPSAAYKYHTTTPVIMLTLQWSW